MSICVNMNVWICLGMNVLICVCVSEDLHRNQCVDICTYECGYV